MTRHAMTQRAKTQRAKTRHSMTRHAMTQLIPFFVDFGYMRTQDRGFAGSIVPRPVKELR